MPCSTKRPLKDKDNLIMMLKQVGKMSNVEIAEKLGVTEGAIRYQLKKIRDDRSDGRKKKPSQLSSYHDIISLWITGQKNKRHRQTIRSLDQVLRTHHRYTMSYDALRRYIRKYFPEFMKRSVRLRVETPPGKLMQVDWKEDVAVQLDRPGNWVKLQFFLFILGFSRKTVAIVSLNKDIASWLHCHQEAFRKIGGLAATARPDCLSSAVVRWKGHKSRLTNQYYTYLASLGVTAFPARPGTPTDKGKVEKKINDLFRNIDLDHYVFRDLHEVQLLCDTIIAEREEQWRCGATGLSVAESFAYEQSFLRPLPAVFPSYPLREERCFVRNDMTVYFMKNYYQVPKEYVGKKVLCQCSGEEIIISHDGHEICRSPYLPQAAGMVTLQERVVSDPDLHISDTVRKWAVTTAKRQVGYYHDIIARRSS